MSTCPNTGVRDFPIKTTVNITDALVNSIHESYMINVQWGLRATAPTLGANGMLQEGSSATNAPSTTSLRLQGNSYTLFSAQLVAPIHKDFVKATEKPLVKAELLLIFKSTSSDIAEKYVFFCVPVLQSATTTPNVYLQSILQERLPGRPISLSTLVPEPKDQEFFAYSTCLSQVKGQQTVATQVRVLIFHKGIRHSNVNGVLPKAKPRAITAFPAFQLPEQLRASTMPSPFMLDNETTFGRFLRSGNLQADIYGRSGELREDTTSAYKCVPLNPDTQVVDGKIKVDTTRGELLSKVLQDRSSDLNEDMGKKGMSAEDLERMIAVALGIALGLLVLMILAYFVSRVTASPNSYSPGPVVTVPSWIRNITPTMFISIFVGILGFVIGGLVVYYAK